jgi:hypothetical protein
VIKLTGRGGRLFLGARLVARFGTWEAEPSGLEGGGPYTLRAEELFIDPVWRSGMPQCPVTCEVTLGKTRIRRSAEIHAAEHGGTLVAELQPAGDGDGSR